MTYKDFLLVMPVASNADEILAEVKDLPLPDTMCGVDVPKDLNKLSIGELIALQQCDNDNIMVQAPCIVLGVDEKRVMHEQADKVLAFDNMVARELERIGKLFATLNIPPTDLQKKAGYDKLDFGPFAIIDNFALRMHITDHEVAERVPWPRVFKCMHMDTQRELCRRRAEQIQINQMKQKK